MNMPYDLHVMLVSPRRVDGSGGKDDGEQRRNRGHPGELPVLPPLSIHWTIEAQDTGILFQ
jgi:hypothetical protein